MMEHKISSIDNKIMKKENHERKSNQREKGL